MGKQLPSEPKMVKDPFLIQSPSKAILKKGMHDSKNTVNYGYVNISSQKLSDKSKFFTDFAFDQDQGQDQSAPSMSLKQDFSQKSMTFDQTYRNETQNQVFSHQTPTFDKTPQNETKLPPANSSLNGRSNKGNDSPASDPTDAEKNREKKMIYNLILNVLRKVKEEALDGVYNEMLFSAFWTGLQINEFYTWLSGTKYGDVKVCKDVWRHRKFDSMLGHEHNYKVALTQMTKEFLKSKSLADMEFEKDCQYNLHYHRMRDLILLAMESNCPKSINFRKFFLQK